MDKMSNKKKTKFSFSEVWGRLTGELKIKNLSELAEIIGVSQPTISRRKNEEIFPIEWAYLISKEFEVSLEWLLEGMERKESATLQKGKENKLLDEIDNWLTVKAEKEPEIIDWFTYEILKKFPEFAEWKRKADKEREDSFSQQQNVA